MRGARIKIFNLSPGHERHEVIKTGLRHEATADGFSVFEHGVTIRDLATFLEKMTDVDHTHAL